MADLAKTNNAVVDYSQDQLDLIKRTVAKGATDDEFKLFIHLSKSYGLDPFAKQIWFIKYSNNAPSIFTSRDGYLKIAHDSGVFDGMNSYTIDDKEGNPVKGVCEVFRKDMTRPFKAEVKFSEYDQKNNTWKKYPSAMLIKVAEVFALKRAFSISGLVTQEEMGEGSFEKASQSEEVVEFIPATEKQLNFIHKLIYSQFLTEDEVARAKAKLKENHLSKKDAGEWISSLETVIKKRSEAVQGDKVVEVTAETVENFESPDLDINNTPFA